MQPYLKSAALEELPEPVNSLSSSILFELCCLSLPVKVMDYTGG